MTPLEVALHARKKVRQLSDARAPAGWPAGSLDWSGAYPQLPDPDQAPAILREALAADAERILSGRWRAFREIELRVDDPPRWHKDYLRGADLANDASAFSLDHRRLPNGADIKLIWELSPGTSWFDSRWLLTSWVTARPPRSVSTGSMTG